MPSVHQELEIKYDVDDAFEVPPLGQLVSDHEHATPVVEGEPVTHRLEATYFDTADHRLARAGLTLRRRTGGEDAGWHLKVPGPDGGRQEVRLPLGRSAATVPAALRRLVRVHARGAALVPVADIVTERTVRHLVDATGQVLVEVADDRVRAQRLPATDGATASAWRELEVELHGGDRAWLDVVDVRLRDLGVRVADTQSKLARVLATGPVPVAGAQDGAEDQAKDRAEDGAKDRAKGGAKDRAKVGAKDRAKGTAKATAGDVVLRYVTEQVAQILANDVPARVDTPGSVHRMRVATRRLRSALNTFGPVLRGEVSGPLRQELKWLAAELGAARDAEVLRERLLAALDVEQRRVHLGQLGDTMGTEMSQAYRAAHDGLLRALDSDRYHRLVQDLDGLLGAPPFTAKADRPAAKVLPRRAARAYATLRDLVDAVHEAPPGEERDRHLHEARKAAKKARYAGETLTTFFGKPAAAFAAAMERLQEDLGEHQDSVVMRERLADLARRETSPEAAFAYGRLHAQEERRGDLAVERFEAAWREAARKSLRRWLG
jgi:CHAD domain-containing protein